MVLNTTSLEILFLPVENIATKSFYMGTEKIQPLTLINNYPDMKLYIVKDNLSELITLDVEIVIDWAILVTIIEVKWIP